MAANDLRWGLVGSERRFRIFRRDFRTLSSGEVRPFFLMSDAIYLNSPTLQITKVLLYMLLTGRQELPRLAAPYSFPVSLGDPMTSNKNRNRMRHPFGWLGSLTKINLLGNRSRDAKAADEANINDEVCRC